MAIQFEIVTPEKTFLSETVDEVYYPGAKGETGVLTTHTAMVGAIETGVLTYKQSGNEVKLAIGGGFAEVKEDKLLVITDFVVAPESVKADELKEELAKLEGSLEGLNLTEHEDQIELIEGDIARVKAQLAL